MTLKNTVRELYQHPLGKDFIDSFLFKTGRSHWTVFNPLVQRMSIKTAGRFLGASFTDLLSHTDLLSVVNDEFDLPDPITVPTAAAWWKEAVFYNPTTGVADDLDYFLDLGITALLVDSTEDVLAAQAVRGHGIKLVVNVKWGAFDRMLNTMKQWLEWGADGFCLNGIGLDIYGYQLHKSLKEIRKFLSDSANSALLMGTTRGIGPSGVRLLSDAHRKELDLVLSLDDVEHAFDFHDFYSPKRFYMSRLNVDKGHGWHSLALLNVKRDAKEEYQIPIAKMLAVMQFTLRGTPFIWQGDELGNELGNVAETNSRKQEARKQEARKQELDANSVLSFYHDLIILRKSAQALHYGALTFLNTGKSGILNYTRILSPTGENFYIEVNMSPKARASEAPTGLVFELGNYGTGTGKLRPYEARIYKQ